MSIILQLTCHRPGLRLAPFWEASSAITAQVQAAARRFLRARSPFKSRIEAREVRYKFRHHATEETRLRSLRLRCLDLAEHPQVVGWSADAFIRAIEAHPDKFDADEGIRAPRFHDRLPTTWGCTVDLCSVLLASGDRLQFPRGIERYVAMRILIATVTAGAGHLQAAFALEEAWRLLRPRDAVERLDVLDFTPKLYRKAYVESYVQLVEHAPICGRWLFNKTDNPRSSAS